MQQARFFLVWLMVFILWQSAISAGQAKPDREKLAREFVKQLEQGEFEKAVQRFDTVMTKALPPNKLEAIWKGVLSQYGSLQRIADSRTEAIKKYQIVFVTCQFERGQLDTKVVFTEQNEIAGLFFVPGGVYRTPGYVDKKQFEEVEVTVGAGLWAVPGTLSLPKGDKRVPAVVLVHGSGPHDRDETIGPNKPFRDLAQGLASRGVAVLRYEKRTKHHQLKMALLSGGLTVKEESVDDAVAAVDVLANQPRIETNRIYVLGHSLGGNLLPRIGAASAKIAGFISFAGSVRPLEDLVLDQVKYLFSLDGAVTAEEQQKIDAIKKQVEMVKSPALSADFAASELPLGISAPYWLDLRGYQPAVRAQTLQKPFLILQGERDYQVTMVDFDLWKQALGSRADVTLISYTRLNHLFMAGEGKSTPSEYLTPGHVEKRVIVDIAKWIKAQK
ncbi:alpha/beta hydrolase [Gimesia fumaroli]|uniref:Alpha/beta hydrolase family protein n=1 Tax=Gimesia fumaroli TaxID=2527976 RepID=A0A518I8I1_9PLAN|nr:alpha/beta fold hydrolase [Gimesia fumaroli]QDV49374.1 Alpha/beta hydrolase family protein [Gimesia fumaroli]